MVGIKLKVLLAVLLQLVVWLVAVGQTPKANEYGPEVKSFLDLMRHEEDELEFQIRRREISRRDYVRSKTRIAIHRQTVLELARETGQDDVPELHIVTGQEVDQLIENGTAAIKGIKRGDVVAQKWRYLGSVHRGETFHIFERLASK
ncbi:MAG TPA: hypothetical protein VLM38_15535 [Blastocatellia bacterium]|nr:hypothetical protein [Blastocatellia bacterium]